MNGETNQISRWIHNIIEGTGGLHAFERYEVAVPNGDRDVAVAEWVVRCLANTANLDSERVLNAILEHRAKSREAVTP